MTITDNALPAFSRTPGPARPIRPRPVSLVKAHLVPDETSDPHDGDLTWVGGWLCLIWMVLAVGGLYLLLR